MGGHEGFDQAAEAGSFNFRKQTLATNHPDWLPEQVHKQALIDFNTQMFPKQVETYFSEKTGERISHVEQKYEVIDGRLVDPFYGAFQKMIDYATSDEEREILIVFEQEAIRAKPGEIISILDTSALGRDGGVKYLDTFEKDIDGFVKHKDRIDLTGEGKDLSFDEALLLLQTMKQDKEIIKEEPSVALPFMVENGISAIKFTEPILITEKQPIRQEKPALITGVNGFWFAVTTATKRVAEIETKQPAMSFLVGTNNKISEEEVSRKDIKPTRSNLAGLKMESREEVRGVQPTGIIPEGAKKTEYIPFRNEMCEIIKQEPERRATKDKPSRIFLEDQKPEIVFEAPKKTSRINLEVFKVKQPTRREPVGLPAESKKEEFPIYLVKRSKIQSIKDIPEWIWQGQGVIQEEIIDWQWLLVTIFHALLNTKMAQSEKIAIKIN